MRVLFVLFLLTSILHPSTIMRSVEVRTGIITIRMGMVPRARTPRRASTARTTVPCHRMRNANLEICTAGAVEEEQSEIPSSRPVGGSAVAAGRRDLDSTHRVTRWAGLVARGIQLILRTSTSQRRAGGGEAWHQDMLSYYAVKTRN